jgi:hypothetical protein
MYHYLLPNTSKITNDLLDNKQRNPSWKSEFVDFIGSFGWHWFITIPIGKCPPDDEVLRRLSLIEGILTTKHITRRYHKLPDTARYTMAVAFEGERICGTRHAHILVRCPQPRKRFFGQSPDAFFPMEFRFLWYPRFGAEPVPVRVKEPRLKFERINGGAPTYTVKKVQKRDLDWSRFEFVTPPRHADFSNENLSMIKNRNNQKRSLVHID